LNEKTKRTTTSKDCIFVGAPHYIPSKDLEKHIIGSPWAEEFSEKVEEEQNTNRCNHSLVDSFNKTEELLGSIPGKRQLYCLSGIYSFDVESTTRKSSEKNNEDDMSESLP
jgi:hypothetical protein